MPSPTCAMIATRYCASGIAALRQRLQQLHGAREFLRLEGGDAACQLHIQS